MNPDRITHEQVATLAGIQPARVRRVVREFEREIRHRWHGSKLIWQLAGGDLWITFRSLPEQLREEFHEREFRRREVMLPLIFADEHGERHDQPKKKKRRGRPKKSVVRENSPGRESVVR